MTTDFCLSDKITDIFDDNIAGDIDFSFVRTEDVQEAVRRILAKVHNSNWFSEDIEEGFKIILEEELGEKLTGETKTWNY